MSLEFGLGMLCHDCLLSSHQRTGIEEVLMVKEHQKGNHCVERGWDWS